MGRALGRLIRRQDFLRIAGSRRKWVGPGFILQAARTPELDVPALPDGEIAPPDTRPSRLGFTASKKVGNSVTRNRARRRLRHAAREILAPYSVDGHDFVLIARAATPGVEYAALKADLLAALRRLGLYRAEAGSES